MAFKLCLKLKRSQGNNDQVFYKIDGQRFKKERTLKLSSSTEYEIEVTIKPTHEISSMTVQGTEVKLTKVLNCNDDAVDTGVSEKLTYTGTWNTLGMPPKKDGERYQLPVTIQISDIGELSTYLQCKLYRETDMEHVTWGQPLHWIDFDCQKLANRSFIDVFKESYR